MASTAYPVVVWGDSQRGVTVSALDWLLQDEPLTSFDLSRAGALRQIQDYIAWQVRMDHDACWTEFLQPVLEHISIPVRPEYRGHGERRRYPCERMVQLVLPCVHGRTDSGILCGALPTLGIGFYYYDVAALRHLATERARQLLAGQTPQQLSRYLPPATVSLDQVHVASPRKRARSSTLQEGLPHLQRVADALGAGPVRKAYGGAYQREVEVAALVARMKTRSGSLLLLGESGVGKSTILVAAVRALERKHDASHRSARIRHRHWSTNASRLVAGMKYLGQWQDRVEKVIDELSQIDGVLCFPSVFELLQKGGEGPEDSIAAFLLPYIQHGELRVIAEATASEWEACRRLLPPFAQALDPVAIEPLVGATGRAALSQVLDVAAGERGCTVEEDVVATTQRLHQRFLPYHPLPGRAAWFLRRLLDTLPAGTERRLTSGDVVQRFIAETGLPDVLLDDSRPLDPAAVLRTLEQQVIGQREPCAAATQLVVRLKAGLNDPHRPLGTLLFCGPTGVGKTQLAKSLAAYLFGAGEAGDAPAGSRLVRLDMSEYSAPWSAERLIARPDGRPSEFIERVRAQPFCVVLFDEIEKAAPPVFDLLLGLLDEGRLTDRYGRTTWFRVAAVIMTSNLGAATRRAVGFGNERDDAYEQESRAFFRPEFFNRLDGVVTFRALSRDVCRAIARRELAALATRTGLLKRNLRLDCDEEVVQRVVAHGFDPRFGARPLQRAIQELVVSRVARLLVGPVATGAVVRLRCRGGRVEAEVVTD